MTKHGETVSVGGDLAQPSWNWHMVTPSKGGLLASALPPSPGLPLLFIALWCSRPPAL